MKESSVAVWCSRKTMCQPVSLLVAVVLLCGCATISPQVQTLSDPHHSYVDVVKALELQDLGAVYSDQQIEELLAGRSQIRSESQRRAAAVLVSIGALDVADLDSAELTARKLEHYVEVMSERHPALLGRVGDVDLLSQLSQPLDYAELLGATDVLDALALALAEGVITGYDLRLGGIYDQFSSAETFIYSHSELLHIRQLVTLLAREEIDAWVYLTPKVSAFLYRENWGTPGDNVVTLANGIRVVQGQEMAVLFRFDSPEDRARFQAVIDRYAKRDSKDETGLIAGAWWQPFYYTHQPMPEFEAISLVVLAAGDYEATLTVLEEKAQLVVDALLQTPWPTRQDRVWVNPAFYRFLHGDYR